MFYSYYHPSIILQELVEQIKRFLSVLLIFALLSGLFVPASAAVSEDLVDLEALSDWSYATTSITSDIYTLATQTFTIDSVFPSRAEFLGSFLDVLVSNAGVKGRVTYDQLVKALTRVKAQFTVNWDRGIFVNVGKKGSTIGNMLTYKVLGLKEPKWTIVEGRYAGCGVIYDEANDLVLCDSRGRIPYYYVASSDDTGMGLPNIWVELPLGNPGQQPQGWQYSMVTKGILDDWLVEIQKQFPDAYIRKYPYNNEYYVITLRDGSTPGGLGYADASGKIYAAWVDPQKSVTEQVRPDTQVKDENGQPAVNLNGVIIDTYNEGNTTQIDIPNFTVVLPTGETQIIDQLLYSPETNTYFIDSHDVTTIYNEYTTNYNNYITNYYTTVNQYHYEYHIDYTSVTYIGQTAEYDKYYEVYYELPDGRDSADLTAAELEQLNTSVDVIPYGRGTDDVSVRSLYHFDGNTEDSSFWSYETAFTWNEGASLTYMDAGTFGGALYLDEGVHDFSFTLPSPFYSSDFTIQWRYYQSATASPSADSTVKLGSSTLLTLNGSSLSGGSSYRMPTGTWNEIAIIRDGNTLRTYLNGLQVYSSAFTTVVSDATITFHFGSNQQTFKYFDELRVLNNPLVTGGAAYTPTSVPYDTNLALVLPDSAVPIADEYWESIDSPQRLGFWDFSEMAVPSTSPPFYSNASGQSWAYYTPSGWIFNPGAGNFDLMLTYVYYNNGNKLWMMPGLTVAPAQDTFYYLVVYDFDYVPSIYLVRTRQNNYQSWTFSVSYVSGNQSNLFVIGSNFNIRLNPTSAVQVRGIELLSYNNGTPVPSAFSKVTSVTLMDSSTLNSPTLAARTQIPIKGYTIGGIRPSVPTRGQVWALVESGYITSLQVYTGYSWEQIDGRIWTGSRWVPMTSYNVVTLKDTYEIIGGSGPEYEYIYTESGFWAWWQRSWTEFQNRLFGLFGDSGLGGGSTGGGSSGGGQSLWDKIVGAVTDGIAGVISALFDGIAAIIRGLIGVLTDMVAGIWDFLSVRVIGSIRDFFGSFGDLPTDAFVYDAESDTVALPDDVAQGAGFVAGVFGAFPAPLRSAAIFGVGITVFFAVLKILVV